jgi:hypothetical protein
MACHTSEVREEEPCAGYLVVEGYTNLAVRLGLARGSIEMWGEPRDPLWPSFSEMLAAYEEAE